MKNSVITSMENVVDIVEEDVVIQESPLPLEQLVETSLPVTEESQAVAASVKSVSGGNCCDDGCDDLWWYLNAVWVIPIL